MYIMPIFIRPHCNANVPLVQYCVITNSPVYSVPYFYESLLASMNLSPTL